MPWFPRTIVDLDSYADKVLEAGADLEADHPGFKVPTHSPQDQAYRERRASIVAMAKTYRHGMEIPRVQYTAEEIATWGVVYDHLTKLYPTHACKEHNTVFPLLEKFCGYSRNNIPQLQAQPPD